MGPTAGPTAAVAHDQPTPMKQRARAWKEMSMAMEQAPLEVLDEEDEEDEVS